MNTNLNRQFSLERASTDISNRWQVVEDENKEEDKNKDDIDKKLNYK